MALVSWFMGVNFIIFKLLSWQYLTGLLIGTIPNARMESHVDFESLTMHKKVGPRPTSNFEVSTTQNSWFGFHFKNSWRWSSKCRFCEEIYIYVSKWNWWAYSGELNQSKRGPKCVSYVYVRKHYATVLSESQGYINIYIYIFLILVQLQNNFWIRRML